MGGQWEIVQDPPGHYDSSIPEERSMNSDRVNPSSQGWGVAAFIIALAVVANVTAYSIHKATYLKPDKAPAQHEARN